MYYNSLFTNQVTLCILHGTTALVISWLVMKEILYILYKWKTSITKALKSFVFVEI